MPDKIDQLYEALRKDGAATKGRDNFRNYVLAPGDEGVANRKALYEALKADGAVTSPTQDEFERRLGISGTQQPTAPPTTTAPNALKQQDAAASGGNKGTILGGTGNIGNLTGAALGGAIGALQAGGQQNGSDTNDYQWSYNPPQPEPVNEQPVVQQNNGVPQQLAPTTSTTTTTTKKAEDDNAKTLEFIAAANKGGRDILRGVDQNGNHYSKEIKDNNITYYYDDKSVAQYVVDDNGNTKLKRYQYSNGDVDVHNDDGSVTKFETPHHYVFNPSGEVRMKSDAPFFIDPNLSKAWSRNKGSLPSYIDEYAGKSEAELHDVINKLSEQSYMYDSNSAEYADLAARQNSAALQLVAKQCGFANLAEAEKNPGKFDYERFKFFVATNYPCALTDKLMDGSIQYEPMPNVWYGALIASELMSDDILNNKLQGGDYYINSAMLSNKEELGKFYSLCLGEALRTGQRVDGIIKREWDKISMKINENAELAVDGYLQKWIDDTPKWLLYTGYALSNSITGGAGANIATSNPIDRHQVDLLFNKYQNTLSGGAKLGADVIGLVADLPLYMLASEGAGALIGPEVLAASGGARVLQSTLTMTGVGLVGQGVQDWHAGEFSGVGQWLSTSTSSAATGATLGVFGEAARGVALRPTSKAAVLFNKGVEYAFETAGFTLPEWVSTVYNGVTPEGDPITGDYFWHSAVHNFGVVVAMKGRRNFKNWKPVVNKGDLAQLQSTYPDLYDNLTHNLDMVTRGKPVDELSDAARKQLAQLQDDMNTPGKGVSWTTYKKTMNLFGFEVVPPRPSSVRVEGNVVQVLDSGGNVITEKKYANTKAATQERDKLHSQIEHDTERVNAQRYDASRREKLYYDTCSDIADRMSDNKEWRKRGEDGNFLVDENGNYIPDENYRCVTPEDVDAALKEAYQTPEGERTADQVQHITIFEAAAKQMSNSVPTVRDLAQMVCDIYGISVDQLERASNLEPSSRRKGNKTTQAMALFNDLLNRGVTTSGKPVGRVKLKHAETGDAFIEVYNEANPANKDGYYFYKDATGQTRWLPANEVESYEPIMNESEQRYKVSNDNAKATLDRIIDTYTKEASLYNDELLDMRINNLLEKYDLNLDEEGNILRKKGAKRGEADIDENGMRTDDADLLKLQTFLKVRQDRAAAKQGEDNMRNLRSERERAEAVAAWGQENGVTYDVDYLVEHPLELDELVKKMNSGDVAEPGAASVVDEGTGTTDEPVGDTGVITDDMLPSIEETVDWMFPNASEADRAAYIDHYTKHPEEIEKSRKNFAIMRSHQQPQSDAKVDSETTTGDTTKTAPTSIEAGGRYNVVDEQNTQHEVEVLRDNGNGTVEVRVDGAEDSMPMAKDQLAAMLGIDVALTTPQTEQPAATTKPLQEPVEQPAPVATNEMKDADVDAGESGVSLREKAGAYVDAYFPDVKGDEREGFIEQLVAQNDFENTIRFDKEDGVNLDRVAKYEQRLAELEKERAATNSKEASDDSGEAVEPYRIDEAADPDAIAEAGFSEDNLAATVDYLNGKIDERAYLERLGFDKDVLAGIDDDKVSKWVEGVANRASEFLTDKPVESGDVRVESDEVPADAGTTLTPTPQPEAADATEVEATTEPMPLLDDGNPNYAGTTPERGRQYIYDESGLDKGEADAYVSANLASAEKDLDKIKKKPPKMGTNLVKYQKDKADWESRMQEAQSNVDYWNKVRASQADYEAEQAKARKAADAKVRAQAVVDEQARQAAELAKQQEQAERGAGAVHPAIAEKWNNASKIEGYKDEVVLANGERVPGTYYLVESGAVTPSHNASREFEKYEGFPVDENGNTINDRDYERDKDAQNITRSIADKYDSRALQTPVIVSKDGVVLSGNGRTMAGELAASNNTDGAYIEHLKNYGRKYGFSPEQVTSMKHPRAVFVPDADMPYTTDTFAKFNAQEMKGQSKTEQAVKLGKVVDDATFNQIVRAINEHETLGDFYNNTRAATEAINALRRAGAINDMQNAEMFDGDAVSDRGRQIIENMLIGKAFEGNPDVIRMLTEYKGFRQSVVTALNEISTNVALGKDYSLENELAQAIELAYKARKAGFKENEPVSPYATQLNLFPFEDGETVADYNNAAVLLLADLLNDKRPTLLKKKLQDYNQQSAESAAGQMDIFAGGVKEKKEIIKTVLNTLHNGEREETQRPEQRGSVADERGGEASLQEDGAAGQPEQGESNIQGLEIYSEDELRVIVEEHVRSAIADADMDAEITGIRFIGSRTTGTARADSDLDVLVEYQGTAREDSLFNVLNDEDNRLVIDGITVDINPITPGKSGTIEEFMKRNAGYKKETTVQEQIALAEQQTETSPSEAQKEAGNYKKGHVKIDGFDISIEQPKGSVRSGVDASGKSWRQKMNNTYGYIRGTEGVDGDHIDVFLSDDIDGWNGTVYVVDQVNNDGSFDEHKVMYGFNSEEDARQAYLSNYEDGWQGLGAITAVSKDEFKKWIGSSHRKTKPFAEYKNVKVEDLNATSVAQHKRMQMEIINQTNPMTDDVHTGIRSESDILTLEEAVEESLKEGERGGWATLSSYPDVPNEVLEEALRSGKIRVYSSDPIEDGVFVTPSRMQAEDYAGGDGSKVYEKEVPIEDVAWINTDEGQLARVRNAGDRGVVQEDAVKYETASRNTGRDIALDDRVSQREYLLSDNYVASLTGKEFAKSETPLTEKVARFYAENYGGKVERDGVGTVLLDERSVKDSIAHGIGRNKAVAFAAVPDIIKNGAIIDRQENWKGRGYGSVTFAAPIEIANEGYVGVVVANEVTLSDGSHRFYLHEVALQENLLSEEFKTGINTGSKQGDVAKVLKEIVTAKENSGNVANEDAVPYGDMRHGSLAPQYQKYSIEEMDSGNVPFNGKVLSSGDKSKFKVVDDNAKVFNNWYGSTQKRYQGNVGKKMGNGIYLHKDYATEVIPEDVWNKAQAIADREGINYNTVYYEPKKRPKMVRFDEAPDFDTAREPFTGNWVYVDTESGDINSRGQSKQIWHNKWMWVKDDYTGFDVEEAYEWSKRWNQLISNPDGWAYKWDYLLNQAGLPIDWSGSALEDKGVVMDESRVGYGNNISQGFGSAGTSIPQTAGTIKGKINWRPGTVNVDIGGGRFDKATNFLKEKGVENLVFDPFNRNAKHNKAVAERVRDEKVDTVTCTNVLNVIDNEGARANVILQAAKALKEGGTAYFSVYEGDKSGVGRQTKKDSWQNNRRTKDYVPEIEQYFEDVTLKNGVITARNPIPTDELSVWDFDGEYNGNGIAFERGEGYGEQKNSSNVFAFGENELSLQSELDIEAVDTQRANMPKTAPWREGVDEVVIQTTLPAIKKKYSELHAKAKAGDVEAAEELISNVVKPEKVKALVEQHPNAIVAFVHALENSGRNQLPAQYAQEFEMHGLELSAIIQTNRPSRTDSDKVGRFVRRSRFDGKVEPDREYIIVDDHVTMGSTLRDLKDYIESKGGKVVAVSTLTASAGGTKLRPTEEQIKELNNKGVTNEQLKELGIADGFEGLTRSEAREVLVLANSRGNQGTSRRRTTLVGNRPRVEKKASGSQSEVSDTGSTYYGQGGDVIRFESHAEQLNLFGTPHSGALRQHDISGKPTTRNERVKRASEMSDAELLSEMGRDIAELDKAGRADWGVQTLYSEEYDRRHIKEYNAECERVRTMLDENNVSIEEAEDMLCNAIYSWRDGYATADRSKLLAQFDTLNDYYAEKTDERDNADLYQEVESEQAISEADARNTETPTQQEVAPTTQQTEPAKPKKAAFDPSAIKLRKLKSGETCHVERRYQESGGFDFTGSEKVESDADLAYIFRNLENSAIENTFLVLIKNGKATILHVGMGGYAFSAGHLGAGVLAASQLKPDSVIFVHNHPSGTLQPSQQDIAMQEKVKKMFGADKAREAIIIDITSGKYSVFDSDGWGAKEKQRPTSAESEVPYKTYSFSQQVFAEGFVPGSTFQITDSDKAAEFISGHRLGERDKLSLIVLNRQKRVTGNIFLPWTSLDGVDVNKAAGIIAKFIHQMGGESGILYGSGTISSGTLSPLARAISNYEVHLDDFISVEGKSAYQYGAMEPEVEYEAVPRNTGQQPTEVAEDGVGYGEADDSGISDEELAGYDAGRYSFAESITQGLVDLALKNTHDQQLRLNAMREFGGNLAKLRKIMNKQKAYDKGTVDDIVRLARMVMGSGFFKDMSAYEVKRLLAAIKKGVGAEDLTPIANNVVDMLVQHQLRESKNMLHKLMQVRGRKVDARGVEVQAGLDIDGQRMMSALKDGMSLGENGLLTRINDCENRLGSEDEVIRKNAMSEYQGLMLAKEYHDNILSGEEEEIVLRNEKRQEQEKIYDFRREPVLDDDGNAIINQDGSVRTVERKTLKPQFKNNVTDENKQLRRNTEAAIERIEQSIRESRMERVTSYIDFMSDVAGDVRASRERAAEWRAEQQQRVDEIHHNANSDLEGVPVQSQVKLPEGGLLAFNSNNDIVRLLFQPLATFEKMLRFFGRKAHNGEGYLFNRFMRGWVDCSDKEWRSKRAAHEELDAKVNELFGKKAKRWSDLYKVERNKKHPGIPVEYWDNGERVQETMSQGEALSLVVWSKQKDAEAGLRRMGISEEDIETIKNNLDPKFLQLAEWVVEEFLPKRREYYNAVHERMFGAPMAAIEHYFPIVRNSRDVEKPSDITERDLGETKPSTITGNIIKRQRTAATLDVHTDFFDHLLKHLDDMENWAAWAEFNRDINTLRNYKRFKNRVLNMHSVEYGSGKDLWKAFDDACAIAAGVYHPSTKRGSGDNLAVNIAKGVTGAKIAFRFYTAAKQLLSLPAFWNGDAGLKELAKWENPVGAIIAWNWAMKNLPGFSKRWQSRQVGDVRLMDTDSDYAFWRNNMIRALSRGGMWANALVDGMTVAMGARSVYETKKKRYLRNGYSEEQAEKRAMQDAAISYNSSQQSSEDAFLSSLQLDRTWWSTLMTVFRSASMGYQRRLTTGLRNLKNRTKKGYKAESIAFMKKQMERDGVDEATAEKAAKRTYRWGGLRSMADVFVYGFVLPFFWNLGPYALYLLMGDDDDEKKDMLKDASVHSLFGPIEGLTGGNAMSEIGNTYAGYLMSDNDKSLLNALRYHDYLSMPLGSDLQQIFNEAGNDSMAAWTDAFNLLVQAGIGINPETFTDTWVAIADACDGDPQTTKEFALCFMRVMQVPQTQTDKLFIDELGMTAKDAQKLNAMEMADRYARYKKFRNAPLLNWAYSPDESQKVAEKYRKRFLDNMQERMEHMDDEQLGWNFENPNDSERRKAVGKVYAKGKGVQDSAGKKPASNWKPETRRSQLKYQRLRDYNDLAEDVLLDVAIDQAKNRGDGETEKALRDAKKELTEIKRGKHTKTIDINGLGDGSADDDKAIMEELRARRKEILREYGVI